jgi:imidazolonepropionase-like amidohydrolase
MCFSSRPAVILLICTVVSCQSRGDKFQSTAMPAAEPAFAVVGGTLIDGTGSPPLRDAVILVQAGRIQCVGARGRCAVPRTAVTLNAAGRWIIPGMIDTHAHWFVWWSVGQTVDTLAAGAHGARTYLANGITTIIDVAGQRNRESTTLRIRDLIVTSGQPAPRIFLSGRVDSLAVNRARAANAGELTQRLIDLGVDGIKIHRGLSAADLRAVVTAARNAGRPVYGHTYEMRSSGYHDYTRAALDAGVNGVFHVMGMAPVSRDREPPPPPANASWQDQWLYGATRWRYVTDASADSLIDAMVRRGTWLQPTLVTEELTADPAWFSSSPNWIYSPLTPVDSTSGWPFFKGDDLLQYKEAYERMKWFVRRLHEAGGMLVVGTDGTPIQGFGVQEEMRLLTVAGVPPLASLQAATRNAARAFGLTKVGTIESGNYADFVILNGDPLRDIGNARNIWRVIKEGRVHDPKNLLRPWDK